MRCVSLLTVWPGIVIAVAPIAQVILVATPPARAAGLSPRKIAVADDEAGEQAAASTQIVHLR